MVDRQVTILGAGESGTGAALLAKSKGYDVFVSDAGKIKDKYKEELKLNNIKFEEGKHSENLIFESSLIIKSPGIPETADIIKKAQKRNIQFIDEIEFAAQYSTAKIIAITGTNGKTTTTLLTYHLLKEAGVNVGLAGNVGHSLAKQVIEDKHDYYVVEISSFQLDGTVYFNPFIGVLLNITPDHLDRYGYELSNYIDSKFGLVKNMTAREHFIYYKDDMIVGKEVESRSIKAKLHPLSQVEHSGVYAKGNDMFFDHALEVSQHDTTLKGKHNLINTMAAVTVAQLVGVSEDDIRSGLRSFKNAPHRMEYIATINDVDFVNDSKATNVDAVKYALDSFESPLIWIAGGVDKGNNYDLVMESVNAKVKALVCLGKDNEKLRDAFHDQIINMLETDNMKDAVRSAMDYASANDTVLLSPACASFDLFNNYEDRGDQFRTAVLELKKEFEEKALKQ